MEKIYLSDSGPKVSPAVYGFWRWQTIDQYTPAGMESIISLCLDLGINTFDHADHYGGYECEELFGNIISKKKIRRQDIVLFTKCGIRVPHPSCPDIRLRHADTSALHIERSVESSLRKLRTDYIDIFLLEDLDILANIEETALALERLRTSGKIRNIGINNFSVFQHQLLASFLRVPIVTNHVELNLLNTTALDNGQLSYIKQRYMRPLVTAPLADGRIEHGTDELAIRVHHKLQEVGEKYGANVESVAVAWLIKLGALPVIGTREEQRIKNIVNAFNIELDRQDWYDLYYTASGQQVQPLRQLQLAD
ncbi:MAG TPA: aldo/keto reductase [Chitinophagaceae bacterium]|nr:aldo/keto reductase [Chitinophagaceae bacterium]